MNCSEKKGFLFKIEIRTLTILSEASKRITPDSGRAELLDPTRVHSGIPNYKSVGLRISLQAEEVRGSSRKV